LLKQAFLLTVSWMGTSPLAILVSVVLVPFLILLQKLIKQGWRGLWTHITQNIRTTALYTTLIWSLLVGFGLFITVPRGIRTQADRVSSPLINYPIPPAWAYKFDRKPMLPTPRSHIHVTAVDLVSASPGEVIKARVHFQNNGDAAITHCRHYIAMAVLPFFENVKTQTELEDGLFDGVKKLAKKLPIAPNQIPAHSISLNSDNHSSQLLTPELCEKIRRGEYAVYLVGRIEYKDSNILRHSDYCYLTKGDVDGMKICFVHNQEP
jgi:hypothetical protein